MEISHTHYIIIVKKLLKKEIILYTKNNSDHIKLKQDLI